MVTTPRRIATYTLLEPIGHGGMASVYRAHQETLDRIVAVKVLAENLAASEEFIERFRREARTAANLRHPNVITVHDFGQDERGVPYLVLEFIEGATLADLMDSGLDDARVPDLLDQIAAGLDYAHAHGVIHRDVKPGNVLMTADGRAVLADFGLAALLEGTPLTLNGSIIGTPEYISPEQACGDPVDHRCDVYSLGVVLYEMLTGERPFSSETPMGVLLKHLREPVPSVLEQRPELPVEVDAVVARALAKDPEERYASAGELARSFRAALFGVMTTGSSQTALASGNTAVACSEASTSSSTAAARLTGRTSADVAPSQPAPAPPALPCPGCSAELPEGAGICPVCMYMIPLDQLPRPPRARKLERREIVINLLPYRLRWNPDGLTTARRLAADALRKASVDGWEPASIGEPYRLVAGRTIGGEIVERAVLQVERLV